MEADQIARGKVLVRNLYDFITLEHLNIVWSVSENGQPVQSGNLPPMKVKAHETETLVIPFKMPSSPKPGAEYFLNISFVLGCDTLWARCGHEIAWGQFQLPVKKVKHLAMPKAFCDSLEADEDSENVYLSASNGMLMEFSKVNGVIASLSRNGLQVMERGPLFNVFRAPTDND